MSYQIRSANGQRSSAKINLNETQTRDDILEALRGIVIEFELKIDNLIEESIGKQNDNEKQEPGKIEVITISIKKDKIISDLKTKLSMVKCQQVAESDVEVIGAPASVTVSQEKANDSAGSAKPQEAMEPRSVANIRNLKRVSSISPRARKP